MDSIRIFQSHLMICNRPSKRRLITKLEVARVQGLATDSGGVSIRGSTNRRLGLRQSHWGLNPRQCFVKIEKDVKQCNAKERVNLDNKENSYPNILPSAYPLSCCEYRHISRGARTDLSLNLDADRVGTYFGRSYMMHPYYSVSPKLPWPGNQDRDGHLPPPIHIK